MKGIMGLAYHALDTLAGDDVFGKLVEANNLENAFSMCLGYSGGVLTLGGMDPRFRYLNAAFNKFLLIKVLKLIEY
jgi:hypothetical protein